MSSRDIEFLASVADRGRVAFSDVAHWFGGDVQGQRALRRLEQAGLVFPFARGQYAIPSMKALPEVLPLRPADARLAAWLAGWIRDGSSRAELPEGLAWSSARFLGLALHMHTNLAWDGPAILVPILENASHLRGLHHRVPVFALDPADEPMPAHLPRGAPFLLPSERELVRVLGVHNDPRIREAATELARELQDPGDLKVVLARTDPPTPFPDPKASLPRGPPFRYRLYAPQSWVKRNLEFAKPEPSELGVA